jgi:hypothetical protein
MAAVKTDWDVLRTSKHLGDAVTCNPESGAIIHRCRNFSNLSALKLKAPAKRGSYEIIGAL